MEYDVAVIGAGPGGYVAAIRLSQLGLKTVCIEKNALGGTCLNVGCIPSKTLLHTSELFWKIKAEGAHLGIHGDLAVDLDRMHERKREVISQLTQGITGLFQKNKVTFVKGSASFTSLNTLLIDGKEEIKAKSFIIATGSEPIALPFLPFDEERVLSSTGALSLKTIPKRLAVIGAGVIGVELGSIFQRLGSKVFFVEFMDRITSSLDKALSTSLEASLKKQGMEFFLSSSLMKASLENDVVLSVDSKGKTEQMHADAVLVAVGRKPYTADLGLEKIGISLSSKGLIPVDRNFRTLHPHILAIGDVIDGPMLAHKASEEGVLAAEILGSKTPSLQYLTIPNVIYTYPEVASVGLSEEEASAMGLSFHSSSYPFKANARAKCAAEEEGFIKILADKKTDKILGVHVIGPHASELIGEGSLALAFGKTAREFGSICRAHPTLSEAFKEAALSIHNEAIHSVKSR
jgi:dihydrolipoamide dehydrogenase